MSRISDLMYGPLENALYALNGDLLTLEETQCALINAINHIRTLEARLNKIDVDQKEDAI